MLRVPPCLALCTVCKSRPFRSRSCGVSHVVDSLAFVYRPGSHWMHCVDPLRFPNQPAGHDEQLEQPSAKVTVGAMCACVRTITWLQNRPGAQTSQENANVFCCAWPTPHRGMPRSGCVTFILVQGGGCDQSNAQTCMLYRIGRSSLNLNGGWKRDSGFGRTMNDAVIKSVALFPERITCVSHTRIRSPQFYSYTIWSVV